MENVRNEVLNNLYLINLDDGVVLVLTVHTSYRKTRSDLEKSVTSILATKHIVFEIEESSPSGSGHIPHWAGKQRFREMGWEQNKSVLSRWSKFVSNS